MMNDNIPALNIKLEIGAFEYLVGAKASLPLSELILAHEPTEVVQTVINEMIQGIFIRLKEQAIADLEKGE